MTSLNQMLYTFLNPWENDLSSFALSKEQISTLKKSDNCNQLLAFPQAERTCWEGDSLKVEVLEISKQCVHFLPEPSCGAQESASCQRTRPQPPRGACLGGGEPPRAHLPHAWNFRIRAFIPRSRYVLLGC